MWLQYLFQCRCPHISEQARFPEQAQVLVSACQEESEKQTVLSPMLNAGFIGGYRLNNVWWIGRSGSEFVLINAQERRSLTVPGRFLLNGAQLEPATIEQLQRADNIFRLTALHLHAVVSLESAREIEGIVLTAEDDNYLLSELIKSSVAPKWAESSSGFLISRNARFLYRGGIRLGEGEQRIVDGSELGGRLFAVGWTEDDRGALLEGNNSLYLYGGGFQVVVPTGPLVPQPILLLRVPSEYLPPSLRQEVDAQLSQEQAIRTVGNFSVLLSLGLALFSVVLTILQRRGSLSR